MTQQEIEQLFNFGRQALTRLAAAAHDLAIYSEAFEARGGQPVFGDDALFIVYLSNDLKIFLDAPKSATIARLRTDI